MMNIKTILNHLIDMVIDESLENDKTTLLNAVTNFINTKN